MREVDPTCQKAQHNEGTKRHDARHCKTTPAKLPKCKIVHRVTCMQDASRLELLKTQCDVPRKQLTLMKDNNNDDLSLST